MESQDGEGKNAFDFSVPLETTASGKRSTETGEEREAIVELVMPPSADAARTLRFINELQERLDAGILQTVGFRDSHHNPAEA